MPARYGYFAGGIDLPEEKHATLDVPVRAAKIPQRLTLEFRRLCFSQASPEVSIGQKVSAGQLLARVPEGQGLNLFSPAQATVAEITDGGIVLEEVERWEHPGQPQGHMIWQALDMKRLRHEVLSSSLAIMRRGRVETLAGWLQRAIDYHCGHLVMNAMETQPYVTSEHRTLVEFGRESLYGMVMLARAGVFNRMTLVVDSDRTDDYGHLLDTLTEFNIEHVALPRKYPIGEDEILLSVLRKKEIPAGGNSCQTGASVIDPWTCMLLYRLIVCEQRLGGRLVTLAFDKGCESGNYFVPFGMGVYDLLGPIRQPVIHGGPMNGRLCTPDDVVNYGTDALLVIEMTSPERSTQCIRCGWCIDHCPARLNVSELNNAFETGNLARAKKLGVISCINCGVCSYVCPAKLPLKDRMGRLKSTINDMTNSLPLFHLREGRR
ncbi:MAG TPA: 4Fe-4S dicluster domain-containing protein [Phycisphaerae bacterium]|nr:4Fe-4S dicluster domain-containing protein [Phycisphaerae bacterium]HPS53389.1 4Fe-4S dicluster domain-containing protein [Phycisphaerae bacterium]